MDNGGRGSLVGCCWRVWSGVDVVRWKMAMMMVMERKRAELMMAIVIGIVVIKGEEEWDRDGGGKW